MYYLISHRKLLRHTELDTQIYFNRADWAPCEDLDHLSLSEDKDVCSLTSKEVCARHTQACLTPTHIHNTPQSQGEILSR